MVRAYRKKKPVKRMTHAERRERRKQMAKAVRSGKSRMEVARDFGVTMATVHSACQEFSE